MVESDNVCVCVWAGGGECLGLTCRHANLGFYDFHNTLPEDGGEGDVDFGVSFRLFE